MAKRVNYGLKEALKLKEERKRKRKELEDKGWITQRISPQVKTIIEEVIQEIVEETIKEIIEEVPVIEYSSTNITGVDTIAESIFYTESEPEPEPITSKVQCPICRKLYMPQGFPRHFEACQKLDKYQKELEELEEKDGNGTND